jgi:hypothetical protein
MGEKSGYCSTRLRTCAVAKSRVRVSFGMRVAVSIMGGSFSLAAGERHRELPGHSTTEKPCETIRPATGGSRHEKRHEKRHPSGLSY